MAPSLNFHPASEIFDLMSGEPFAALVEDIGRHGLLMPIWLHPDGSILDGRNRYRACGEAGVPPVFETWDETGSAAEFVWSLNFTRRHLDGGAAQMAAGRYAIELEREARGRQGSRTDLTSSSIEDEVNFGRSAQKAADKFSMGHATVERAVTVARHGIPELSQMVERSAVSVSAAADVARLPDYEQRDIVAEGSRAVVEAAKEIRAFNHRAQASGDFEWYTPMQYLEAARDVLGEIDLDPASSEIANRTVRASRFFTLADDGLTQDWKGKIWLNPPYAQPAIMDFITKLVDEVNAGNVKEAIALTHNSSDTRWFHLAAGCASAVCFTSGRIRFLSPTKESASPTQGQAFFYFGDNAALFSKVFGYFGVIMLPETLLARAA